MALSNDLRERVVAAVNSCQSRRRAGERFAVSAVRWLQRVRETGSFDAKPQRSQRIELTGILFWRR